MQGFLITRLDTLLFKTYKYAFPLNQCNSIKGKHFFGEKKVGEYEFL